MIRTTDLNMAPVRNPYYAIVFQGQPANVDTVMVDGRMLVRGGRLTAVDVAKLTDARRRSRRAPSMLAPGARELRRPLRT